MRGLLLMPGFLGSPPPQQLPADPPFKSSSERSRPKSDLFFWTLNAPSVAPTAENPQHDPHWLWSFTDVIQSWLSLLRHVNVQGSTSRGTNLDRLRYLWPRL